MKIPAPIVCILKLTLPFAAAVTLNLPPVRAAALEAQPAVAMPPVIRLLNALPDAITAGGSTQLRWSATGAESVTLTADDGSAPMKVSGNSVTVHPAATTTYTLTAVNAAGETVKKIAVPVTEARPALPAALFAGPATSGLMQHRR